MTYADRTRGQTNPERLAFELRYLTPSNSESGAAPSAAGFNHCPACARFHTNQKSVGTAALGHRGLVGAFHGVFVLANLKLQRLLASVSSNGVDTRSKRPVDKFHFSAYHGACLGIDLDPLIMIIFHKINLLNMIDPFWQQCLTHLHGELSQGQYNNWIKPLNVAIEDGQILLLAPNSFVLQWVRDRFLKRFEELAERYFGQPMRFVLTVREETTFEHPAPVEAPAITANGKISPRIVTGADDNNRINPTFTFNNFVAGKANQLARAAAQQVAEHIGTAYNPLFIYGGVGLGKTHLIQAIGNAALHRMPNAKIQYVTSQDYVTDVVRAYQHKSFDSFKRRYHTLDLLLIDDIQFIGGKSRTQEEFFFAFNALIEAHKQVIITCDRFPKELSDVEDRLVSRFGWGLTVAIEPPELEMRVAILINKAAAENVELDESIAFFIAKHIRSNVRELEGALKRVFAYVRFTSTPLSLASTKEALKDLLVIQNRQVSIENIQKTVADYYKIKVAEMYSKKRNRAIARPRQVAMALAKEFTQLSLPDIGEAFGGRDHTTVLHACRKIGELKESDGGINRDLVFLQQILKG